MAEYCTVAECRISLGNISDTVILDAVIQDAIEEASSLVDGYVGSRYKVPLTTVPKMIRRITRDISVYHVFNDHVASGASVQDDEKVENRYNKALALLKEVKKGDLQLPGIDTVADSNNPLWSSTQNYQPTFDMDHETKWGVDGNQLDDIEDSREDAESELPGNR